MPSLTCVSSCDSCVVLSQKVAQIELQMSRLLKMNCGPDQEINLGKTQATATSFQLADTVHFSGGTSPPAFGATSENYWVQRGAKPKRPISSTPLKANNRLRSPPAGSILLRNRFNVLDEEEFPPLLPSAQRYRVESSVPRRSAPLLHQPGSQSRHMPPVSIRTRRGQQHFTPNPQHNVRRPITASPPPLGPLHPGDFPLLSQEPPNPSAEAAQAPSGGQAALSRCTSGQCARDGRESSTASSSLMPGPGQHERGAHSVPPLRMARQSARRGRGGQSVASSAAAVTGPARSSAHASGVTPASSTTTRPGPSVLVLGSSMVRHVRLRNAYTSCHPGALVLDINHSAPHIMRQHPSASTVVIHAGINDLKLQQSEKLKQDFTTLINTIQNSNKQCIISGPLPPPRFGNIKFSRLRDLHKWLKHYCMKKQIPYVDNFLTFFKRPGLFKMDHLHPNIPGSRLLSLNIELTIESSSS